MANRDCLVMHIRVSPMTDCLQRALSWHTDVFTNGNFLYTCKFPFTKGEINSTLFLAVGGGKKLFLHLLVLNYLQFKISRMPESYSGTEYSDVTFYGSFVHCLPCSFSVIEYLTLWGYTLYPLEACNLLGDMDDLLNSQLLGPVQ